MVAQVFVPNLTDFCFNLEHIITANVTILCYYICCDQSTLKTGGPKVYDVTKYLDDHPGGAEVLLDVAGQDADEFFEDIGHSKEARSELAKHYIGEFKMDEAAKAKLAAEAAARAKKEGGAVSMVLVVVMALVGVGLAYYQTQMK